MTNRHYMVTFDISPSYGRTNDYPKVDDALRFRFGDANFWKPLKQVRIIRTKQDARAIRDTIAQALGSGCRILVVRLRRGYAFKIANPKDRAEAQARLQAIV